MIYMFDIDGTICTLTQGGNYADAIPFRRVVYKINKLKENGNTIKLFTARGCVSGKDYTELTKKQLEDWGVQHDELIMNKKPHYDLYVGDKCIHIAEWSPDLVKHKTTNDDHMLGLDFGQHRLPTRGFIASSFDLIHPGYVRMLKDAKTVCDRLICAIHKEPKHERPLLKNTCVHTTEERKEILEAIRYVDKVVTYETEDDLQKLLTGLKPDIRILGDDYANKSGVTGWELNIPIHWHKRMHHGYSTSGLREKISKQWIEDKYE